jgi:siroheme synthase-like protein
MTTAQMFPVSLNLAQKQCLVVGGGSIAERRVQSVLACGATVHVVSPELTLWLAAAAQQGTLRWTRATFCPTHLQGTVVVFVATDDRQTNARIAALARQHSCLVNVVDDPQHCDFYMPAIVRRGALSVAVATDGQAPAFAAWIRKCLDRLLHRDLGQLVAHYARQRLSLQQRHPSMPARVRAWEQLLADDAPEIFAYEAGVS